MFPAGLPLAANSCRNRDAAALALRQLWRSSKRCTRELQLTALGLRLPKARHANAAAAAVAPCGRASDASAVRAVQTRQLGY